MKLINRTLYLNEAEAILFTVGMELSEGSEFNTQAWIKRGCLKNKDGTHKKLISNLTLCAKNVQITGSGKKREYILDDPYTIPEDKIENRKGYVPSSEDLVIDDYVFRYLLKHKEFQKGLPYKSWANELELFDTKKFNDKKIRSIMAEALDDLHAGRTFKYSNVERSKIINEFIYLIKSNGETVVENAFNRLQREDKIIVLVEYYVKKTSNNYDSITELEYRKLIQEEDDILEKHQMDRRSYVFKKRKMNLRDEEFKKVFEEIEERFKVKYGIKYYFKAFKPIVINRNQKVSIEKEKALNAHYNRIIRLTERRQIKSRSNSDEDFLKKWHYLNMTSLFKVFDIEFLPETLKREKQILFKDQQRSFNSVKRIKKEVNDNMPF